MLRKVDAVVIRVPDVESGLDFYAKRLGMPLRWRKEDAAAVMLGDSELVLSNESRPRDGHTR